MEAPRAADPSPAPAASLDNLTAFYWAAPGPLGNVTLEFTWDVGEANPCSLQYAGNSRRAGEGAQFMLLLRQGATSFWSFGASSASASVHAGPYDSRTGAPARNGGGGGWGGEWSGAWNVTILGRGLHPDEHSPLWNGSLALALDCGRPFALRDARAGPGLLLADQDDLAGGAGFGGPALSAGLHDTVQTTLAAPRVEAATGRFGVAAQATRVHLAMPDGSRDWTYLPDPAPLGDTGGFVTGGPGTYTFTVDHAAALEHLWVAAWGSDHPVDLRAGQVPQSPLHLFG